jgi:predicted transcriptional regulator
MEVHELFTELSAKKRLDILKALGEGPMKFTKMSNEFDMTSPEASRQLTRLSDAKLIEKRTDGSYHLTSFGRAVLGCLPNLDFIAREMEYFLKHDTSPLPPDLLQRIDDLSRGEVINGFMDVLNTVDMHFDGIENFFWFVSNDFPHYFLPKCEEQLERGVEYKVIFPEDFIPTLLSLNVKNLEAVKLRALSEVNLTIDISDKFCVLALPSKDGKIDQSACIMGFDSNFREWCKDLFNYYWEKAKPVLP